MQWLFTWMLWMLHFLVIICVMWRILMGSGSELMTALYVCCLPLMCLNLLFFLWGLALFPLLSIGYRKIYPLTKSRPPFEVGIDLEQKKTVLHMYFEPFPSLYQMFTIVNTKLYLHPWLIEVHLLWNLASSRLDFIIWIHFSIFHFSHFWIY